MATTPIGRRIAEVAAGTPFQRASTGRPPTPPRVFKDNEGKQSSFGSEPRSVRPTVKRGMITVPERGIGRTFMFNPNDVSDTKGITWASGDIPGASHPVYQFGSGGERLISFDLYLDGDRGRKGREQVRPGVDTTSGTGPLSIKDELHFWRSLIHPNGYGQSHAKVAPLTVLFSFGELYNNLPCIVKAAPWKINYWVPSLENGIVPVRATIALQLAEITTRSSVADEVLSAAGITVTEV